jgi:hypothetical protein|tara:strand:+ start:864 stop:1385 length:522 start_codon:yes stop_codon:yes gene_type:complete
MMAEKLSPMFDAPIAGQSMTAELGSRPWQSEPKYKTPKEAVEYYLPKLLNPDRLPTLLDMIEYGLPLAVIADSMQTISVMEGLHTLDVGILVIPALIETLIFIAEENKVKYVIGTEKFDDSDLVDPSSLTLAIKKYKNKTNVVEDNPAVENLLEQDKEVMSEAPVGGLMSRRV